MASLRSNHHHQSEIPAFFPGLAAPAQQPSLSGHSFTWCGSLVLCLVLCWPRHHHHRAVETAAPHLQLIIIIIQPGSTRGHTAWRHAPWPAPALTGETQSPYLHLTTTEHSGSSLPTSIIISLNSDTVTCARLASPPPDRRLQSRYHACYLSSVLWRAADPKGLK